MPKRHKHVKPSAKKNARSASPKATHKKAVEKDVRKRRAGNVKTSGKGRLKSTQKSKPLSKGAKVATRGKVQQPRSNKGAKGKLKSNRSVDPKSKRTTSARRNKIRSSKSHVERLRKVKALEQQKKELEEQLELARLAIEKPSDFTNKIKPKTSSWIQEKDGVPIPETKVDGFRTIYEMILPEGTYEDKLDFVRNVDLSFLKPALNRNKGKNPQAVFCTLESRQGDGSRYQKTLSDLDFVVNLNNIKKFTIKCMEEWKDRFELHLYDEGDSYLEGSGELYKPENLYAITYQFIY